MCVVSHLVGGRLSGGSGLDEVGELVHLSHHPYRETTSLKCLLGHPPMMNSLDYFKVNFCCLPSGIIRGVTKRGCMVRVGSLRDQRGDADRPVSKCVVAVGRLSKDMRIRRSVGGSVGKTMAMHN